MDKKESKAIYQCVVMMSGMGMAYQMAHWTASNHTEHLLYGDLYARSLSYLDQIMEVYLGEYGKDGLGVKKDVEFAANVLRFLTGYQRDNVGDRLHDLQTHVATQMEYVVREYPEIPEGVKNAIVSALTEQSQSLYLLRSHLGKI